MNSLIHPDELKQRKEDALIIASLFAKYPMQESKLTMLAMIHSYRTHQDLIRANKLSEKIQALVEHPISIKLFSDLLKESSLKASFIDTETDFNDILVYFDESISKIENAEKFLANYGTVQYLAAPCDEISENVYSNFHLFSVTPKALKESISHLQEKIKKGILYRRARRSAKVTGGSSAEIRKSMLRSLGQKGFINHNKYFSGGDPERISAWEKFVGKKRV